MTERGGERERERRRERHEPGLISSSMAFRWLESFSLSSYKAPALAVSSTLH